MTEPEQVPDEAEPADPIEAPPTANPSRVRVPPEGLGSDTDTGAPVSGAPPVKEA
ncbi:MULTISPECIES: hypothetical protein [Micromonospora]|uniref:Uncharacterized protein n=1 Tax=Micromonospora yangpuensis TaxID=683228 RepID=A0A1C6USL2_9ACTN|nr:hypothetical protein [Micromonospora yangpuensis]GGM29434.1 hypothetical protein GCM10012279_55150 [Micromonospora yangpuensis]SCL56996.1 hypothetical protein GA0070617_3404 [Micromonospora yangpuensis]